MEFCSAYFVFLLINYTFVSAEIFLFMKIKKFIKNLLKLWKYAKKYDIIY